MQRKFLRRIKKRTNYKERTALLKSRQLRFVIRPSLNNIHIQIVKFDKNGDETVVEGISKNLKKVGWKGHCGNVSASYLTGLMVGHKAVKLGVKEAILDIGLKRSTKQNVLYAACKGAIDAGLNIPVGENILPSNERISGKHIEDYAKNLKMNDTRYKRQFSAYLKNGLDPEKISEHFEHIKKTLIQMR
ncbi:50S ribosomal protein L18 [Candidatus Woesearchaeota archaeon]|nr:50S ribosomal protein L18 [Candidatus Woesearchaeota archaeon]